MPNPPDSLPELTPLERELLDACEWARDALSTRSFSLRQRALDKLREAIARAEAKEKQDG